MYGEAQVSGLPCVLLAFEFGFLGGSLGQGTGDRICAAYRLARERACRSCPWWRRAAAGCRRAWSR